MLKTSLNPYIPVAIPFSKPTRLVEGGGGALKTLGIAQIEEMTYLTLYWTASYPPTGGIS